MKKFLSLFLTAVMLLSLIPVSMFSASAESYDFTISGIDVPVDADWVVVNNSLENWANGNPTWARSFQCTPSGDGYQVIAVCDYPGNTLTGKFGVDYTADDLIELSGFTDEEEDIYIIIHCDGQNTANANVGLLGKGMTVEGTIEEGATITFSGVALTGSATRINVSNNIAAGKSYETSLLFRQGGPEVDWSYDENASIAYPDETGKTLTDGLIAADSEYSNHTWIALSGYCPDAQELGYTWVKLDLGEVSEIFEVRVYLASSALQYGIGVDGGYYTLFGSVDGNEYTELGYIEGDAINSTTEPVVTANFAVEGSYRYLEVRMERGSWIFVGEIAVVGGAASGGESSDEPTVDEVPVDPDESEEPMESSEEPTVESSSEESSEEDSSEPAVDESSTPKGETSESKDDSSEPIEEESREVIYEVSVETDTEIDIEDNGAFEGGTIVEVVEVIIEEVHEVVTNLFNKILALDFTASKDGESVQPNGKIKVNIAIPDGFSNNVSVYYVSDDGKMEKINSTVDAENRKVTAEIEHFSTYVLVDNESKVMLGDINGNGEIDSLDYILLKRAYFGTFQLSEEANKSADINGNGEVDSLDYILLKRAYFGTYKINK